MFNQKLVWILKYEICILKWDKIIIKHYLWLMNMLDYAKQDIGSYVFIKIVWLTLTLTLRLTFQAQMKNILNFETWNVKDKAWDLDLKFTVLIRKDSNRLIRSFN